MQGLVEAAALGLLFCGLLWAGPVEGGDSSRWPERYIYLQSGRSPPGRYGAYSRKTTSGGELHRKSIPCEESSSISDGTQIGPALARTASEVGQHRALLLSIALGMIFLVRGYYISKSGSKPSEIQSLRNKLESRMDRLASDKAKLLESKARLSEMQRQIAHEQGIAQGQKLHLERQKLLLHAEEEELRSRESRMEAERAGLREVEEEARQTKKVFLGNEFPDENGGNEDLQAAGRTHTLGQAADMMKRVEAELGVFETAACSSSQASKKTLLVREFTELAKMRAAITVLRALPEEPTNAEEARDILRARRLLLAAAVRCQVISWSTIHRLLQLKVELQAEMILENSGKEGLEQLREVAETEWQVQEGQQKRARQTLAQLEQEIKKCKEKQRQLHEYGANHKNLRRDAVRRLEKQLFDWESYEVTVRATKARILATEAAASTTREVFLRQKRAQIQRAVDNQAQRWRRLPNDSIRLTELQTLLSAVSDELEEAKEIYDMAKEIKDAYEAKHPVTEETPSSAQQKQQAKPHRPLVFEERRRTYLYDRGNLGPSDSAQAKPSHAMPVISTVSASSLSSSGGYKVGFLPRAPEGVLMGKQLSQVPARSSSPNYDNSDGYRQSKGKTQQAKAAPAAFEPGHPETPFPIQQDNVLVRSNKERPPSESSDSEAADDVPYIDDDDDSEETPPLPPPRIIPPPPKRPPLPDNAILETDMDAESIDEGRSFHLDSSSEDGDSSSLPSLPLTMAPLSTGAKLLTSKGFTPIQPSISSSGKPFTEVPSQLAPEAEARQPQSAAPPIPRVDIQEASGPQTHSALTKIANCVVSAGNNGGVERRSIGTSPMTDNNNPKGTSVHLAAPGFSRDEGTLEKTSAAGPGHSLSPGTPVDSPVLRAPSPMPRARSPVPRTPSPLRRSRSPVPQAPSPLPRSPSPAPPASRTPSPLPRSQLPVPPASRTPSPLPRSQSPVPPATSPVPDVTVTAESVSKHSGAPESQGLATRSSGGIASPHTDEGDDGSDEESSKPSTAPYLGS